MAANLALAPALNSSRVKGPVPLAELKLTVPAGTMPKLYPARICGKKAFGVVNTNLIVVGSDVVMPVGLTNGWMLESDGEASLGLKIRRMDHATSAEVSLAPLWKVTPSRRRNVQVRASAEELQDVANAGCRLKLTSARTNRSYTFVARYMANDVNARAGSGVSDVAPPAMAKRRVPPRLTDGRLRALSSRLLIRGSTKSGVTKAVAAIPFPITPRNSRRLTGFCISSPPFGLS